MQRSNVVTENKVVTEPTDRQRIFNRLLPLSEDYDFVSTTIESKADEIILRRLNVPYLVFLVRL
jgi:hypothetical protein